MNCAEHKLRIANEITLISCCMDAARGHCPPDRIPDKCGATLQDLTLCAECWKEYTLQKLDRNEKSAFSDCSPCHCS